MILYFLHNELTRDNSENNPAHDNISTEINTIPIFLYKKIIEIIRTSAFKKFL